MIDQDDKQKNVVGSEPTNRHPNVILPVSGPTFYIILVSSCISPAASDLVHHGHGSLGLKTIAASSWCHPALHGPWNHPGILLQKSVGKIKKNKQTPTRPKSSKNGLG